jgi:hypothetical protein
VGRLWRRRPLHRKLAEQGGIADDLDVFEPRSTVAAPAAELPGFDGEARGATGVHGIPRRRRWDTVTTADAPALRGEAVEFVGLGDTTLILDGDEPAQALEPLAAAVERGVDRPYRAEAVRRSGTSWAVAARKIEVVEIPDLVGDEAELAVTSTDRVLHVDGRPTLGRAPQLERAGEGRGSDYVVRARRLDGDIWEVEASAL